MLRLSRLTDYAIVVLAHMARTAHVCVHPATDIAEATSIPLPTVQKVLKQLGRDGLLRSVRGARGGYALAVDPAEVTVARVIRCIEGPPALTACSIPGHHSCGDQPHCAVSNHWPVLNAAVVAALEAVSILDVSRPEPISYASVARAVARAPAGE